MAKYLYGASVQGIQSFIFETNKLKEIVGASELVEQICTTEFADAIGLKTKSKEELAEKLKSDANVIMTAAGNIKYIFDDEEKCKELVLNFPKRISNFAPGITISQAVVPLTGDIKKDIDDLEHNLKVQRNKAQMPVDIGLMGVERARRTGKPASDIDDGIQIDRGTYRKLDAFRNYFNLFKKFTTPNYFNYKKIPFNVADITRGEENSWLAIVHADGNGLGNLLQNLGTNIEKSDLYNRCETSEAQSELKQKVFKTFSIQLEKATEKAAQNAFFDVVKQPELEEIMKGNEHYPIRPVVLGGDDLTIIIRADLAYKFTIEFLTQFEFETKKHFEDAELNKFGVHNLTACAGIAFIKANYPFHYGADLAESLVKEAKHFSKSKEVQGTSDLPPSSLSFYKVQSSFIEDLKDMRNRTHFADHADIRFDFGPYLLKKDTGKANIQDINEFLSELNEFKTDKSKGVSKLRQWISELYKDNSKAEFMRSRIISVNSNFAQKLGLENPYIEKLVKDENKEDKLQKFSIYKDLIDLHTFNSLYK